MFKKSKKDGKLKMNEIVEDAKHSKNKALAKRKTGIQLKGQNLIKRITGKKMIYLQGSMVYFVDWFFATFATQEYGILVLLD